MCDDFGLLFDAVTVKWPARLDGIVIPAPRVSPQRQEQPALVLPDMHHFVNEQRLVIKVRHGEIVAIAGAFGVEVNVAGRRHHRITRLKKGPFAPGDPNTHIVNRIAEHAAGKRDLPDRQWTLSAYRISPLVA